MASELAQRLIFGPILAISAIGCIAIDAMYPHTGFAVATLVTIGVLLAQRELSRIAVAVQAPYMLWPSLLGCLTLVWWPVLSTYCYDRLHANELIHLPIEALTFSIVLLILTVTHMRKHGYAGFIPNVGAGLLATIYVGLCSSMMVRLNLSPPWPHDGLSEIPEAWTLSRAAPLFAMFIAACKLGDVCAYFGGRAFGTHKMAPSVSPGKTWEGFAASLVGSIGGSYLFAFLMGMIGFALPFDAWWKVAVWGAVLGPVGVVGDLLESCLKRDAGIKDSGNSIPGFGGFLDVFDALLLAAPIAYALSLLL